MIKLSASPARDRYRQLGRFAPKAPVSPTSTERTIHIIDDDEGARKDTAALLDAALGYRIQTYAPGPDFLAHLMFRPPCCVLLSIHMPAFDGMEILHLINEQDPDIAVIVLANHSDVRQAVRAMKAGAVDFLERPYLAADLINAVQSAFACCEVGKAGTLISESARAKVDQLSPRERQVLQGILAGQPNKLMAFDLGLSVRTIEMYRANVMGKLSALNVSHAVQIALAADLEPGVAHLAHPRQLHLAAPRQLGK